MLAGPNGAGKSTFHEVFLAPLGFPFVNADLIAKALFGNAAAEHALAAARLAHEERLALIERRESFIMETVFSDSAGHKLAFFRNARDSGYVIEAHFENAKRSTLLCHYGNMAYRSTGAVTVDPKTGALVDSPESEKFWAREYWDGWALVV